MAVPEKLDGGGLGRTRPQDGCPWPSVFCQYDEIPEAGVSTEELYSAQIFEGITLASVLFRYGPYGITLALPRGSD